MGVLSARLADNARKGLISALRNSPYDLAVKATEDGCTVCVVESRKLVMGKDGIRNLGWITRDPLGKIARQSRLEQDLIKSGSSR